MSVKRAEEIFRTGWGVAAVNKRVSQLLLKIHLQLPFHFTTEPIRLVFHFGYNRSEVLCGYERSWLVSLYLQRLV
jgi:hypothetical protein